MYSPELISPQCRSWVIGIGWDPSHIKTPDAYPEHLDDFLDDNNAKVVMVSPEDLQDTESIDPSQVQFFSV